MGTGTLAPAPDANGLNNTPAQSLVELMTTLGILLEAAVTTENLAECNVEVTKLYE